MGVFNRNRWAPCVGICNHGEEFWEHGGYEHGHTLYNEVLHVPLIVKLPFSKLAGTRINAPVCTASIMPTILQECGIALDDTTVSVLSLSPTWEDDAQPEHAIFNAGMLYFEDRESVIFDGLKYIRTVDGTRQELYNLEVDPGEQSCTAHTRPDIVERARALLADHYTASARLRDLYGITSSDTFSIDEATAERLRSLGYMR